MTIPLCNDCEYYRKRKLGFCVKWGGHRCRDERYGPGRCGLDGKFFSPKPQKTIGYYNPQTGRNESPQA